MKIQLKNKDFDYKEHTQNFIDSADDEDLVSFINQDIEESIDIESDILEDLDREDVTKIVTYMKKEAKKCV